MEIWEAAKTHHKGEVLIKKLIRIPDSQLKFDEYGFGQDTHDFAEDLLDFDVKEVERILSKADELAKRARAGSSRSSRTRDSAADDARPSKRRRLANVNEDDDCKSLF